MLQTTQTSLISKYKTYLKKVTKLKDTAKRNYFQNELQQHKNNISMQWKIINKILCYERLETNSIPLITDERKGKITDKSIIPDLLNEYFTKVGPNMQRWSPRGRPWPRGQILKSLALALASKVKSLALASRPQVLENWPVLGSRTARFFGMLKFCGALEKFFGKRFLVEIA